MEKWDEETCEEEGYTWDDENGICWWRDGLEVSETGVTGESVTAPIEGPDTDISDGTVVRMGVTSYELGDRYDGDMNHVPHVVVEGRNGGIETEADAKAKWDDHNPEVAVQNGFSSVAYLFQNHTPEGK